MPSPAQPGPDSALALRPAFFSSLRGDQSALQPEPALKQGSDSVYRGCWAPLWASCHPGPPDTLERLQQRPLPSRNPGKDSETGTGPPRLCWAEPGGRATGARRGSVWESRGFSQGPAPQSSAPSPRTSTKSHTSLPSVLSSLR